MKRSLATGLTLVILGVAALGCSSSDDSKSDTSSTTSSNPQRTTTISIDLSELEDTPECQAFAEVGRLLEQAANSNNPTTQANMLPEIKAAYAAAAEIAPAEIKADADLTNENVQSWTSFAQVLQQPADVAAASGRVNAWIETNCGVDPTPSD